LRPGPFWTRLAAASGIGFAGAAVAAYVIGSVKDLPSAADVATNASANIWSTWVLLVAVAGVLLLWFTATSAARLSQIEAGSGRVSAEHRMAGAAIAALLFAEVAVQIAARGGESGSGLDALARAIVNGPVLAFAAGVYVLAAGVVGTRAGAAIPMFSGVIARVSLLLGIALIAGGGLWLYRDYAWLNDTAFFAFVGWVFVRSGLGTFRWADLDEDALPLSIAPATRRPPAKPAAPAVLDDDLDDTFEVPRIARTSRPKRKPPAKRKPKAPARKAAPRKAAAERKTTAPKRAPRKAAARRTTPTADEPAEEETQSLDDLLGFDQPEEADETEETES